MATYEDVITQVEREIREHDAFPDASTKLDEQLEAIHRYAVGLQRDLPLAKLPVEKSSTLTKAAVFNGLLQEADLPSDANFTRDDFGISQIQIVDGGGNEEYFTLGELMPFSILKDAADNSYQTDNLMASLDPSKRKIYTFANIADIFVFYNKQQVLADDTNYTTTDINLDENMIDVLVEAVCAHFTSVNAKDLSASQIHSTLSQILKE